MVKKRKEEWILGEFLKSYSKMTGKYYKLVKHICESEVSGPDFIIEDNFGNKEGVEVTKLLDLPSEKEGEQRELEDCFVKYLNEMLDKEKYKNCTFIFDKIQYPSNKEILKKHVAKIVEEVNFLYEKKKLGKIKEIIVNNQKIRIRVSNSCKNNGPNFIFFLYGEEGVQTKDRDNFFKVIREKIKDKVGKSKKYIKDYPLHLVFYDDTRYSIFIENLQEEIQNELVDIDKGDFKYIWMISGSNLIKIA